MKYLALALPFQVLRSTECFLVSLIEVFIVRTIGFQTHLSEQWQRLDLSKMRELRLMFGHICKRWCECKATFSCLLGELSFKLPTVSILILRVAAITQKHLES